MGAVCVCEEGGKGGMDIEEIGLREGNDMHRNKVKMRTIIDLLLLFILQCIRAVPI